MHVIAGTLEADFSSGPAKITWMLIGGPLGKRSQQSTYLVFQHWQVVLHNVPHQQEIDTPISVNQPVAERDDPAPSGAIAASAYGPIPEVERPILPWRTILSFKDVVGCSYGFEAHTHYEATGIHRLCRRRGSRMAAPGARAAAHDEARWRFDGST